MSAYEKKIYSVLLFLLFAVVLVALYRDAITTLYITEGEVNQTEGKIMSLGLSSMSSKSSRSCEVRFGYRVAGELYISRTYGVGFSLPPEACEERFEVGDPLTVNYIESRPSFGYVESRTSRFYWIAYFLGVIAEFCFGLWLVFYFTKKSRIKDSH